MHSSKNTKLVYIVFLRLDRDKQITLVMINIQNRNTSFSASKTIKSIPFSHDDCVTFTEIEISGNEYMF